MSAGRFVLLVFLIVLSAPRAFSEQEGQPPLRVLVSDLRITSADVPPDAQLSVVGDVLAAADGFIFISDNSREVGVVRLYDPAGRFVRSFGRIGDGPGELSRATNLLAASGDTVQVYDMNRGRIQIFRRDGRLVRTQNLAGIFRGDRALRASVSSGAVLVDIGYYTGRTLDSNVFRLTDVAAREIARVAIQRSPPEKVSLPGVTVVDQPFMPMILSAQDPRGSRSMVAVGSPLFGGQPGEVKLVLLSGDGVQSERIVNVGARRMSPALRDAWIKRWLDRHAELFKPGVMTRETAEQKLRLALVTGPYLPEIDNALLGSDGSTWLKLFDVQDWIIISPAGTIVARVRPPPDLRVHQVSTDRLYGVIKDSNGLPIVVRYRVE